MTTPNVTEGTETEFDTIFYEQIVAPKAQWASRRNLRIQGETDEDLEAVRSIYTLARNTVSLDW